MSVEINQVVTDQGKKVDHLLKRSKDTRDITTKSNDLLTRLKERTGRVSICYRFIVYLSIMGFILFLLRLFIN